MADISSLGNLNSAEPIDLPIYKAVGESKPLPRKGVYTVRAPESFPATAFGATKAGFLSAQVDPTVLDTPHEGYVVRFTKVSAKDWKDKEGNAVSQLGRYLKAALGASEVILGDPQAQADAVERTANRVYKALLDWRAYCKGCGFQVEGEEKFPSDGNGGHLPVTTCPNCKQLDAEGNQVKDDKGNAVGQPLRANVVVARYLSD